MYIFSNILGAFVFDDKFQLADEILFNSVDDFPKKEVQVQKLKSRHQAAKEPDKESLKNILLYFKNKKFYSGLYDKNLKLTKLEVKNSVGEDVLISQSVKSAEELEKTANILVKRLREWYELYNPEFSRSVEGHESFVAQILESEKEELLKKINTSPGESFGADLEQENLEPIRSLAQQIYGLYQLRKIQMYYISNLMDVHCPNTKAVCDAMIAAKLIEHAGSLKRLSEMPSSTIQILGAEKALFRHMKTGAKSPKHGVIIGHPIMAKSPFGMHGRIARSLADKISIAAKIDYFGGKFIGDNLRKNLEEKFSGSK